MESLHMLIGAAVALVAVALYIRWYRKKYPKTTALKEPYADTMQNFLVQAEDAYERNSQPAPWLKTTGGDYNPYNTMFAARPDAKAPVSPRFANINYSANIRGQEPPAHLLASGPEPVPNDHAELLNRSFGGDRNNPLYKDALGGKSDAQLSEMYDSFENKMNDQQTMLETADLLPAPSMDTGIGDTYFGQNIADPSTYTYGGHITTLQKHRNQGENFIMGDLLIPHINLGWFSPAQGRSAASILRPGVYSQAIGAPIDIDQDALDTTITSARNTDYQNGIQFQRMG